MGSCCGRPANRDLKKSSEQQYYERYGYLTPAQKQKYAQMIGTKCITCDALTISTAENNCSVCSNPKKVEEGS